MNALNHFLEYSPWAPWIPILLTAVLLGFALAISFDESRRHRDANS